MGLCVGLAFISWRGLAALQHILKHGIAINKELCLQLLSDTWERVLYDQSMRKPQAFGLTGDHTMTVDESIQSLPEMQASVASKHTSFQGIFSSFRAVLRVVAIASTEVK